MTIICSDHKYEMQFFRNHLPCPWILKMIRRNKCSTPLKMCFYNRFKSMHLPLTFNKIGPFLLVLFCIIKCEPLEKYVNRK